MLAKILGWFLIITGVFFLLKPEALRRRLQKKSYKKLRKYLFAITIVLAVLLITVAWKFEGILSQIVIIIGIIGIIKGFFFLKAKAAEKLLAWYLNRPVNFFRLSALFQIAIGVLVLALRK
ncbi:hypothetical protein ACFLZ3_01205 [Candidatus Omnitrophota bacterium]